MMTMGMGGANPMWADMLRQLLRRRGGSPPGAPPGQMPGVPPQPTAPGVGGPLAPGAEQQRVQMGPPGAPEMSGRTMGSGGPGLPPMVDPRQGPMQGLGGKPQAPGGPSQIPSYKKDPYGGNVWDELGPEGVDKVMGMGALEKQYEQAQALRNAETPGGRYLSGGRMYVASNPLEHAVTGYGRYKGNKDSRRIEGEQKEGRKSILDLLRGGR